MNNMAGTDISASAQTTNGRKPFALTDLSGSNKQGGTGYGSPADVWSWGVLVCELIGGFNPFQG